MLQELKDRIEKGGVVIGADLTMKNLRHGKIEKVLVSSNCSQEVKERIKNYGHGVEIIELEMTNEALGTFCKKQYPISVIGFLKRS